MAMSSPRALEHYTADVVEAFDLATASRRDLKLVLDLSYGAASFVMPNLLVQGEGGRPEHQSLRADAGNDLGRSGVERGAGGQIGPRVGADVGAVIDAGAST